MNKKSQPTEKECTCGDLLIAKAGWTSQDYDRRYQALRACPYHSVVPDAETHRYERSNKKYKTELKPQKEMLYMQFYGVLQAVGLKFQGMKAMDTPQGFRTISTFPTIEDARAYLLDVLDTVHREQDLGIRSKENLDPKYSGGLDFYISPVIMAVPRLPMIGRGWEIPSLSTSAAVAKRRKLTHTIIKGRKKQKRTHDQKRKR